MSSPVSPNVLAAQARLAAAHVALDAAEARSKAATTLSTAETAMRDFNLAWAEVSAAEQVLITAQAAQNAAMAGSYGMHALQNLNRDLDYAATSLATSSNAMNHSAYAATGTARGAMSPYSGMPTAVSRDIEDYTRKICDPVNQYAANYCPQPSSLNAQQGRPKTIKHATVITTTTRYNPAPTEQVPNQTYYQDDYPRGPRGTASPAK